MSDITEDALWEMSDEELEAAFKEAKASGVTAEDVGDVAEQDEEFEDDLADDAELDDEIEDGVEQPDEDSDHDASEEDEEDAESDEDAEETDEDTPDGETEEDEAEPTEEDGKTEPEAQQGQTLKFKANGQEFEFSDKELVDQFPRIFGQAMDYTKKMQAIKPWRKTIDAIEQAKLGHDDVSLMIDVLKGDKTAIAEVLKRTGTDTFDLDTDDQGWVAKDYGRDESALAIKDVVETISQDKEFAITENILSKQWDDKSWNEMSSDPKLINLLHVDVKSGMYDTISPLMTKLKVYDGGTRSDLDYYRLASQQYYSDMSKKQNTQALMQRQQEAAAKEVEKADAAKQRIEQAKAGETKRVATKQASAKRKAAAPTKARATSNTAVNYLEDSDEAFDEWYKNLTD